MSDAGASVFSPSGFGLRADSSNTCKIEGYYFVWFGFGDFDVFVVYKLTLF